jgi:hypothetical protein
MYPGLSHGAYECLHAHGTDEQKQLYLPKLVSGEWTGTMCLTEPHCGTDLGMLRSKAEPQSDGSYADHRQQDLHLQPASTTWPRTSSTWCWRACRTRPRAPRASRCSSCRSSCPTRTARSVRATDLLRRDRREDGHPRQLDLPDEPGRRHRLADRPAEQGPERDVRDDERGAPGRGHAVAGPDRSGYQNALVYAKDRMQMRSADRPKAPEKPADPIIVHPDVRRMLLTAEGLRRRRPRVQLRTSRCRSTAN